MNKNIFILTTGLSGSSVLTGLITKAGYWCGDKTEFKNNGTGTYETYENSRFVELNNQLVALSGKSFNSKSWYDESLRDEFSALIDTIDLTEFKQFVEECKDKQLPPKKAWVLKDPKLWMTIGFWLELFKEQDIKTIILTRDIKQLWLSQASKRIIYDYQYLKTSETKALQNIQSFLKLKNIEYLEQQYDHLIAETVDDLGKLNQFLNTQLSIKDWMQIYKQKKKGFIPYLMEVKAILIYIKNYTSRIR